MTGGTPAAEPVTGRTIPRYRGPVIRHRLRWSGANNPGYRDGGLIGRCHCGESRTIDGDAPVSKLLKAGRQHAGKP